MTRDIPQYAIPECANRESARVAGQATARPAGVGSAAIPCE